MANSHKLKSLIPIEHIEINAQKQIWAELDRPFLIKLAIMPDVHMGYMLPIGGVALLEPTVISPEYVGFDQGCGLCSISCHDVPENSIESMDIRMNLLKQIKEVIPCGKGKEHDSQQFEIDDFVSPTFSKKELDNLNAISYKQLGTLGSGNHFIEIGKDGNNDCISITIHSGSRRLGYDIAARYIKLSKTEDTKYPGGFLSTESELGKAFIEDLEFTQNWALLNRKYMLIKVCDILGINFKKYESSLINENHNHCVPHKDGWLHRKGATPADHGQLGLIPGNMSTGVYVTSGLGNEEYLSSASHGAGRVMSRKQAKKSITIDTFKTQMEGIAAHVTHNYLDEAPDAYKNLDEVVSYQKGVVVDIVNKLTPLISVKG